MFTTHRETSRPSAVPSPPKPPSEDRWAAPVLDELQRLIDAGDRSASGIAHVLNETFGFITPLSRSAVIGKCYRLGLSLPGKTSTTTPIPKVKKADDRTPVQAPILSGDAPVATDLFSLPMGPTPTSGPLTAAARHHLIEASTAYDHHQQRVIDWLDSADDDGNIDGDRPSAPAITIPYWTGNDPIGLMELPERSCHFVTSRSKKYGITHYCGDSAPGGRFCTWHGRLSHTKTN